MDIIRENQMLGTSVMNIEKKILTFLNNEFNRERNEMNTPLKDFFITRKYSKTKLLNHANTEIVEEYNNRNDEKIYLGDRYNYIFITSTKYKWVSMNNIKYINAHCKIVNNNNILLEGERILYEYYYLRIINELRCLFTYDNEINNFYKILFKKNAPSRTEIDRE